MTPPGHPLRVLPRRPHAPVLRSLASFLTPRTPLLASLLLLGACASSPAADPEDPSPLSRLAGESWMSVWLRDERAGWARSELRTGRWRGRDVWILASESHLRFRHRGRPLDFDGADRTGYERRPPFRFLFHESEIRTGGSLVKTSIEPEGRAFRVVIRRGRGVEERRARFGHTLEDALAPELLALSRPRPGQRLETVLFLPECAEEEAGRIEVAGGEGDRPGAEAVRLRVRGEKTDRRILLTVEGVRLETQLGPGMVLRREPAGRRAARRGGGADLSALSLTPPIDEPLGLAPSDVVRMVAELEGLDPAALPSGARQTVVPLGPERARVTVVRDPPPGRGAGEEPLPRYLASTARMPLHDEALRSAAARACGGATDPLEKARRIAGWVHRNLQKTGRIQLPSAADVLACGKGDCTEHALLCAAMCRAASVPARVATGLVYVGDERKRFGLHAWVEAWADRWRALDPALGEAAADATHIKLVEGLGALDLARIAGAIRVRVLEAEGE